MSEKADILAIDLSVFNPASLVILGPLLAIRWRRERSLSHLLCFAVFFFYAWAVLAYTLFPIRLDLDSAYIQDMRAKPRLRRVRAP